MAQQGRARAPASMRRLALHQEGQWAKGALWRFGQGGWWCWALEHGGPSSFAVRQEGVRDQPDSNGHPGHAPGFTGWRWRFSGAAVSFGVAHAAWCPTGRRLAAHIVLGGLSAGGSSGKICTSPIGRGSGIRCGWDCAEYQAGFPIGEGAQLSAAPIAHGYQRESVCRCRPKRNLFTYGGQGVVFVDRLHHLHQLSSCLEFGGRGVHDSGAGRPRSLRVSSHLGPQRPRGVRKQPRKALSAGPGNGLRAASGEPNYRSQACWGPALQDRGKASRRPHLVTRRDGGDSTLALLSLPLAEAARPAAADHCIGWLR